MKSRVFVTGASGYLGGAIAARLARGGFEVHGLTRSAGGAAGLERAGVRAVVGDLAQPESYVGVLKNCDAAVHAAFTPAATAELDQAALAAFRDAAEDGRLRRLLYTSGGWVHGDSGDAVFDESTPLHPLPLVTWRAHHEDIAMDLREHDVETVVLRPVIVYGGTRGILGGWFREARDHGTVTYPGDGSQVWSLVHLDDVAEAYALAMEHATSGERYLLSDGSAFTVRDLAGAVAGVTGAATRSMPREEVLRTLGPYGEALLATLRVNCGRAHRGLGWVPRHTSFVAEIESLHREWQGPREARVP
jgi:nucleoside-diphosphate-sugar epimerase